MMENQALPSVRLKYLAHVEMGQSPASEDYVYDTGAALPFLQGTADFTSLHPIPRVYCANAPKIAAQNDILFSVRAPVGELNLADQDYGIGRGLCAVRAGERLDRSYAWWTLHQVRQDLSTQASGSTYEAVSTEDVANLYLPLPPLAQQRIIADYLDRETVRIDALVAAKERVLELLDEKRRALITRAVTQGLNPDAPMRDSCVSWLGEVPAHWAVPPVYARFEVLLGKMLDEKQIRGTHLAPYLRNIDVQWGHINTKDLPMMDFDEEDRKRLSLRPGDLLVCEGGEVGRTAMWQGDLDNCFYQKALHRLRPVTEKDHPAFFVQVMLTMADLGVFSSQSSASTIQHLPAEKLRVVRYPAPPREEQKAIVAYIEAEMQKLDAMQKVTKRTVGLLKERRAALIAAAVTGQVSIGGSA